MNRFLSAGLALALLILPAAADQVTAPLGSLSLGTGPIDGSGNQPVCLYDKPGGQCLTLAIRNGANHTIKVVGETVSINDFVATSPVGGDIAPALNAALTYLCTTATIHGGKISIPKGFYTTSTAITVPCAVWIQGQGRGANSGANYMGGTLIRTSNATSDVFTVLSRGAVKFSDFSIDSAVTKTAGAAISVRGDATSDDNTNSEFTGMLFGDNLWDGIRIINAYDWTASNNVFKSYNNIGMFLSGEGGTPDGAVGQSHIIANSFFPLNTGKTCYADIVYQNGGDVEVVGNKILDCHYGVLLNLLRGPTGTLIIGNNSFEQHDLSDIRLIDGPSHQKFSNVMITGNEFSTLEDGSGFYNTNYQPSITVSSNGTGVNWISNITIVGNTWNMAVNKSSAVMGIQAGRGIVVGHNTITSNGNPNLWAFDIGGDATKVILDENEVHDMPAGIYNTVGSMAVVLDHLNNVPFSALSTWANGSELYVPDALYGSSPLTGSSTGAFARRINGAWRG